MTTMDRDQIVHLTHDGEHLTAITVGVGWTAIEQPKRNWFHKIMHGDDDALEDIDLDVSIMTYAGQSLREIIYYDNNTSFDESIVHNGDNFTGEGEGDDETVSIDLSKVSEDVNALSVVITSYSGHRFDVIDSAYARIVNEDGVEVLRYDLSDSHDANAVIMANLLRDDEGWVFKSVGMFAEARVADQLTNVVKKTLKK